MGDEGTEGKPKPTRRPPALAELVNVVPASSAAASVRVIFVIGAS